MLDVEEMFIYYFKDAKELKNQENYIKNCDSTSLIESYILDMTFARRLKKDVDSLKNKSIAFSEFK